MNKILLSIVNQQGEFFIVFFTFKTKTQSALNIF